MAMGLGSVNTLTWTTPNVMMVHAWISVAAAPNRPFERPKKAINGANSLHCPRRGPGSMPVLALKDTLTNTWKTAGLSAKKRVAMISKAMPPGGSVMSRSLPTEKGKRPGKNPRRLQLMAMYWAIGLLAMLMPAIKAPISPSPIQIANSAMPRHQPIDNRKIYS